MSNRLKTVRSPLFYVGDKYKLVPQLKKLFPDSIECFFEPFTGGGSVGLNVDAKSYAFNDIDPHIVMLHKMLLEYCHKPEDFMGIVKKEMDRYGLSKSFDEDIVPTELRAKWKKTYFAHFNKAGYEKLRQDFNKEKKKSPLHLYLLLIYGFNRMIRFNSSGEFNVPVGNVDFNNNVVCSLEAYFDWARHKKITWRTLDCVDFLDSIRFTENDFIYLDPPYLISFSEYNKLWTDKNEITLLKKLDELDKGGARFAISNMTHYKGRVNNIFLEWSKNYTSHNIISNYISYHDNSVKEIKEVLITNYD